MKPTTYINWDGLKDIPFFYCDTKEDEENKDFDIYYQGRLVLHDYNHCGHYLYTAAVLFSRIKNKTADWVNLRNLWILRDCVRENYNHGIGVDDIIFGENFDGENLDTLTPLTRNDLIICVSGLRNLTHMQQSKKGSIYGKNYNKQ